MSAKVAPSLLSADFSRLRDEIAEVEAGGADILHLDVMDGHFVPNLTFGWRTIEAVRAVTRLPFDAHLMIAEPGRWTDAFLDAGCDSITFHVEVAPTQVRPALEPYRDLLDIVLVMTVEPGFGGQQFLDMCLPKVRRARQLIDKRGGDLWLQVDGGVSAETIERCAEAGADVFVAGSAVFGSDDPDAVVTQLRTAVEGT